MDTVWCIMKHVDGVPSIVMMYRTHKKALESMDYMTGRGVEGLWIEDKILHN